jgi:hypothetical protein
MAGEEAKGLPIPYDAIGALQGNEASSLNQPNITLPLPQYTSTVPSLQELAGKTLKELRVIARQINLSGRSKMKKPELLNEIVKRFGITGQMLTADFSATADGEPTDGIVKYKNNKNHEHTPTHAPKKIKPDTRMEKLRERFANRPREPLPPLRESAPVNATEAYREEIDMKNAEKDEKYQEEWTHHLAQSAVQVDSEKMRIVLAQNGITDSFTQDNIIRQVQLKNAGYPVEQYKAENREQMALAQLPKKRLDTQTTLPLVPEMNEGGIVVRTGGDYAERLKDQARYSKPIKILKKKQVVINKMKKIGDKGDIDDKIKVNQLLSSLSGVEKGLYNIAVQGQDITKHNPQDPKYGGLTNVEENDGIFQRGIKDFSNERMQLIKQIPTI